MITNNSFGGYLWAAIFVFVGCSSAFADNDLGKAVAVLGITSNALAAAGATTAQTSAILASLSNAPELSAFLAARAGLDLAQQNLDAVLAQADPLDPEGVAAIHSGQDALATAKSCFDGSRAALMNIALLSVDDVAKARLQSWSMTPAGLPAELRIVAWTAAQLQSLQQALLDEQLASAGGDPLSGNEADLLANARAREDVVAARSCLQSMAPSIEAIIAQATQL